MTGILYGENYVLGMHKTVRNKELVYLFQN